jgi:tetratricopeptide (TPR) repeat protein
LEHFVRDAYLSTSEHEKAIEDYEEALDLGDQIEEMQASLGLGANEVEYTPDDGVLNNLAWVLSTSTNDELRDGDRAVELATLACEVTDYKAPHILSTLASAYAEKGDFEKAIEWIEKGIEVNAEREITEIVTEEEIKRQLDSLNKELESYKEEKPWREDQAEEDAAKIKAEKEKAKKDKEDSDDKDKDEDK